MELHRTYGQCHADVIALDWSEDSCWIAASSKDLTVRIFSLDPIEGYTPPTLSGHKDLPLSVHFTSSKVKEAAQLIDKEVPQVYTLSRDGALRGWSYNKEEVNDDGYTDDNHSTQTALSSVSTQSTLYAQGHWKLTDKYFFNRPGSKLTAAAFHKDLGLLAIGFSTGLFELLQLPDMSSIHTLSIGREPISSLTFDPNGNAIAVGSANLGQLLVWEWRTESYLLKQQGHYAATTSVAFSPDGAYLVTGADDSKVKVWTLINGFCFVTFADHQAPVTAVAFAPSGHAVLSASIDGTVRAFDMVRYRNFRTLTSPSPAQFISLAIDPGGEIVVAGSQDTFQIFVWSLKTGRLLDVLAGHEGPVVDVTFAPGAPLLASASWDGTVRTWDVFSGKGSVETLRHGHDVLSLAWRPDGRQLASSSLDGQIYLWDPIEGELHGTIHGRRDIAGGRLRSDVRAASHSSSGRCFTSLAYSADGAFLLAGGSSKYVCMYDVVERVMLRRFQITHNRSMDGVLDQVNSRNMTDAGPLDAIDDDDDDDNYGGMTALGSVKSRDALPGTKAGKQLAARTRCVSLSPTGRTWAAATTEGVLMYALDETMVFDPTDLAEDITPEAMLRALGSASYLKALLIALRLRDSPLVRHALLSTPGNSVEIIAAQVPPAVVPMLLSSLGELMEESPHVDHVLQWVKALCTRHGPSIQGNSVANAPALRTLHRSLARLENDVMSMCQGNLYSLRYLCNVGNKGHDSDDLQNDGDGDGVEAPTERKAQEGSNSRKRPKPSRMN